MFDKLKKLLKIVNFSGVITLKDGSEVMVDGNIEAGSKVSIQSDDEVMPLPDGEYIMEDDSIMVVSEGVITDVIEANTEEVVEEEVVENEEVVEEEPTEEPNEMGELKEKISDLEKRLADLEALLLSKETEMKKELKEKTEKLETDFNSIKTKMEITPGAVRLNKTIRTEQSPSDIRFESLKSILKNK